jgi:ubiquinone biosynthesis protein UbiJ
MDTKEVEYWIYAAEKSDGEVSDLCMAVSYLTKYVEKLEERIKQLEED